MTQQSRPAGPLTVSKFEGALLRLLRSFLRGDPVEIGSGKLNPPRCLSAACVHLVRDTLSKGCVLYLARAGGWRRDKHLRLGVPLQGRLWERTPVTELGLSFSRHSLDLLIWLTAGRPAGWLWEPDEASLTIADRFLVFLAYDGLRVTEAGQAIRGKPQFAANGLCRLYFPEDFLPSGTIHSEPWLKDIGASILEALQPPLHRRWLEVERGKNQIGDWGRLRQIGQSQEQGLTGFLDAADAAKRPDLARFLLKAMAELLSPDLTPAFWIGGLQGAGPPRLAERLDTQRHGLAVLRQVERLGQWAKRARGTGYLDEDYAVAQLWLSDWEQYRGDNLATIAHNLLRQLEPLRVTAPAGPQTEDRGQRTEDRAPE
ncbi:MAG: hypothetical protein ACJ8F7_04370 [Gemmataceae bacterium]